MTVSMAFLWAIVALIVANVHCLRLKHVHYTPTWSSVTKLFAQSNNGADMASLKKLREVSGAPMMDCKAALLAADVAGDIDRAVAWLRAKGLAKVAQSTRVTKEGLIGMYVAPDASTISLVEVNCETDFVKRNKDFQQFVALLAETVSYHGGKISRDISLSELLTFQPIKNTLKAFNTVEEALGDVVASIRETILIKRASIVAPTDKNSMIATYMHNKVTSSDLFPSTQLGKIASVVILSLSNPVNTLSTEQVTFLQQDTGKKLAMHIVASQPLFLDAKNASKDFILQETKIFEEQLQQENEKLEKKKTPEVLKKMLEGKINKRLSEVSLLQQNHQAEENMPLVSKVLEEVGKTVGGNLAIEKYCLWSMNQ